MQVARQQAWLSTTTATVGCFTAALSALVLTPGVAPYRSKPVLRVLCVVQRSTKHNAIYQIVAIDCSHRSPTGAAEHTLPRCGLVPRVL